MKIGTLVEDDDIIVQEIIDVLNMYKIFNLVDDD